MGDYKENKGFRLLDIHEKLNKGELLVKSDLCSIYKVSEKTIQRDIDDIRAYLQENHYSIDESSIVYDKNKKGYRLLKYQRNWFSNEETMAVCKILLESRAFCKEELDSLIDKLLEQSYPENKKVIDNIIGNEKLNYVPLQHGQKLLPRIWELSEIITNKERIVIKYIRQDKKETIRDIKPVSIMFSEFYFYLIAYSTGSDIDIPIVYRIDRIQKIEKTNEKFTIPYANKFQEGEFRKRVQFMYAGELKRVKFEFSGPSLEAILDRLPTAEVVNKEGDKYIIIAESYGDGIDMWLRTQGKNVRVI